MSSYHLRCRLREGEVLLMNGIERGDAHFNPIRHIGMVYTDRPITRLSIASLHPLAIGMFDIWVKGEKVRFPRAPKCNLICFGEGLKTALTKGVYKLN
jgi:hypothetical protein